MALVSISNLGKYFPENKIFEDLSFSISENEKIGLIGKNGSGKTTLFKIIAGKIEPSKGKVHKAKNISIGYLSQKFNLKESGTVHDELIKMFTHLNEVYEKIQKVSLELKRDNTKKAELQNLMDKYERLGGYRYETKIKQVMGGLNILQFKDRKIRTLSGGEKVRVALAKVLVQEPDLILLDEPTNHLDLKSINWLGEFIKKTKSAVFLISHNRYLLKNSITKIAEIVNKDIKIYRGNYDFYKKKKQNDLEYRKKRYKKQKKKVEKLKAYIRKYKAGNRATMAKSREKMLEKISLIDKPGKFEYNVELNFNNFEDSGNDILKINSLDVENLFSIKELNVFKNDKIGIIGKNGCGKTTLLNTIIDGNKNISYGKNLKISYFRQNLDFFDEDIHMVDYLNEKYFLDEDEAREYLGYFDFSQDEAFKIIRNLSGGERARFKLLDMILESPNLIIMDEPTNHLDINFLEVLEEGLKKFKGTLIVVSHDLFFLKNVINKLWFMNNKKIKEIKYDVEKFLDNFSYTSTSKKTMTNNSSKKDYKKQKKQRNRRKQMKRRLKVYENKIENIEKSIKELENKMQNNHSPNKLEELYLEKEKKHKKLLDMMEKWEYIKEKLD
ncbi:MAG: ABC-F family ATP-binding cassette domain-containing protein [Candidatus Mcinerneyibacterium aminivorans]|uniref:ABC-F family ATP-binding cassette domain-containing protein n=1 Tax=Candidatus Mcinerneyibacterium aminivorans TaxID=2703815 RepID=A0A5D0MBW8_9BACT|nr:MAG: ABC-F family ATP-binding cassette domain-containing protein [Candidatus Mcinerneyibacterium aminivorans]